VSCPLCNRRKGKRWCPARGEPICSACCGAKRRVEVPCPEDCLYLSGAHAASWEGRETERLRDGRRVGAHAQDLTDDQGRLFLGMLIGLTQLRAERRDLDDRLLAEAVSTHTRTLETRERGVLYDHQADDLRVQGVVNELTRLLAALKLPGDDRAPRDADLLAALRALGTAVAATLQEQAGPTAFLDSAARLTSRLAPPGPGAREAPRIIVP
jgi:hypothetical protein